MKSFFLIFTVFFNVHVHANVICKYKNCLHVIYTKFFLNFLKIMVTASKDEPESCKDVDFVTRTEWGARVPIQIQYQIPPLQYVLIHHTVTPTCSTESGCAELLKNMQNFHMDELEYYDIGYK